MIVVDPLAFKLLLVAVVVQACLIGVLWVYARRRAAKAELWRISCQTQQEKIAGLLKGDSGVGERHEQLLQAAARVTGLPEQDESERDVSERIIAPLALQVAAERYVDALRENGQLLFGAPLCTGCAPQSVATDASVEPSIFPGSGEGPEGGHTKRFL
jgi:hypothetical protein